MRCQLDTIDSQAIPKNIIAIGHACKTGRWTDIVLVGYDDSLIEVAAQSANIPNYPVEMGKAVCNFAKIDLNVKSGRTVDESSEDQTNLLYSICLIPL